MHRSQTPRSVAGQGSVEALEQCFKILRRSEGRLTEELLEVCENDVRAQSIRDKTGVERQI